MVARVPCHPAGSSCGPAYHASITPLQGPDTVPGRTNRTRFGCVDRPFRHASLRQNLCEKAARPHAELSDVTVAQASLWFPPAPGLT